MAGSNSFYNSVASEYDAQMKANAINERVRAKVAEYFQSVVNGKCVMDFGGGTGADLQWLSQNHDITFCEPSEGMRKFAIERIKKNERIHFLDNGLTDFNKWDGSTFPEKFDGVLANFCVFNVIGDVKTLFTKLEAILNDDGCIIGLMLDTTPGGILKQYIKTFIGSFIKNETPSLTVKHNEAKHTVYLHTPKKIGRSLPSNLVRVKIESLGKSGFMLVYLKKIK